MEQKVHKQYDLEERTFKFAKRVRIFIKKLPKTLSNIEDAVQLNNATGFVGTNYIEANDCISKKDCIHRIKISRKESKEARYWLRMIDTGSDAALDQEKDLLIQEAAELMNILSSIMRKLE
jgi:four helix bundle protein